MAASPMRPLDIQSGFTEVSEEARARLKQDLGERILRLRELAQKPDAKEYFASVEDQASDLVFTANSLGYEGLASVAREVVFAARIADAPRLIANLMNLDASTETESVVPPPTAGWLFVMQPGAVSKALGDAIRQRGQNAEIVSTDRQAIERLCLERRLDAIIVDSEDHTELLHWLRSAMTLTPRVIEVHRGNRVPPRPSCDESYDLEQGIDSIAAEITERVFNAPHARVVALVEDRDFVKRLPGVLEPGRIDVLAFSDPKPLQKTLATVHPDLLILDLDIPGFDTLEVLRELRSEPRWRRLAVMILMGRPNVNARLRAYQLGADDVIQKPIHPTELRVRVEARLQRRMMESLGVDRASATGLVAAFTFERVLGRRLSGDSDQQRPWSVGIVRGSSRNGATTETAMVAALGTVLRPSEMAGHIDDESLAFFMQGPADACAELVQHALGEQRLSPPVSVVDTLQHPNATPAALIAAASNGLMGRSRSLRPKPMGQRRVLVADVDDQLRTLLCRMLEYQGYGVEQVQDGKEAMDRLVSQEPAPIDLLIVDVHMPRMDGFDVLRAIAAQGLDTKVLVLSAQSRDADIVRALAAGAEFVAKPFSTTTLLARIGRLLDQP